MGWHVPHCGMSMGAARAGYGYMSKPGGNSGPDLPAPVIPPVSSADIVIPPVVQIRNVFGLCGVRQGDVVTMRRDDETEQQFKMRVGLVA